MIVETTNYYAKEGLANAVLSQRRKASAIRQSLGLDPGRILVKHEGDGPDIRWDCSFPSKQAYQADRATRANSQEFEAARRHMHSLVLRFERHVYELDDNR